MKRKKIIAFLYINTMLFCHASLALARAGGGHSSRSSGGGGSPSSWGGSSGGFSGGGYSGSGASFPIIVGGGGSDGGSFDWLFILLILFVLYCIVSALSRRRSTGGAEPQYTSTVAPEVAVAADLADKLAQFKEKDPGFNEQSFQDTVSTAFFNIENAWCARDMSSARQFLSDSVLSRFQLQLEEYKRNNTFNRLDELSLDKVTILDITSDGNYDTIDIWLTATAYDYIADAKGAMVSKSRDLSTWDEKWSFMRSVKVQTKVQEGVKSTKCPNCGAPLEINAVGECAYCHSKINRFDFDWVLSEIEQLN